MSAASGANRQLLVKLAIVAFAMFAFGYALVPFYKQICEVAGLNRILQPDTVTNTQVDRTRTVTIEFDANIHDLPWRFKPLKPSVSVHPGELARIDYEVANTRDRAITGQAVPSYGPQLAGQYFRKMECFCFTQQTLKPGEKRDMPVVFVVDPALPKDINTITLSYTFFQIEGADAKQVAAPSTAPSRSGRGISG
jgi:cytochrome c oxidase assembly protein subunit 11